MTNGLSGVWFARKPSHGHARMRLFCFPYAGAGASVYRLWPADLPAGVEVWAVQPPGREARLRETPCADIHGLVEAVLRELQPAFDLPFAFFGHSMGAVVAAELTTALSRQKAPLPVHLFVSGHRAPHLPDPDPRLSDLAEESFVGEINRRYGGIPPEILQERELLQLLLPCLRADVRALENYCAVSPLRLECPVSVFGGADDRRATPEQLAAWREGATGPFHMRVFSGGHFYLNASRSALLAEVSAALERTDTRAWGQS